jgi:hypothetical protein
MGYLTNNAAAVREMGITKVKKMAEQFHKEWVMGCFIPKIQEEYHKEKQSFNIRMCCLMSLASVMPVLEKQQITDKVLPFFLAAMKDKVPNVQFCVARIIEK